MILVTKSFKFEMAHYLPNHNSNCKYIHGHSYKLEVTISAKDINRNENDSSCGMIIDFTKLKEIVTNEIISKFDHSFTIWDKEVSNELKKALQKFNDRVNYVPYRPTAENMCIDFYQRLKDKINNDNMLVKKIRIYETDTSYADFEID